MALLMYDIPGDMKEVPKSLFTSGNMKTIDLILLCDGTKDCLNGEEELDCFEPAHSIGHFCDDGTIIPIVKMCDGNVDCNDGTDETNSNCSTGPCQHLFRCNNGQCIENYLVGDGLYHCIDKSDEHQKHVQQQHIFSCYDADIRIPCGGRPANCTEAAL